MCQKLNQSLWQLQYYTTLHLQYITLHLDLNEIVPNISTEMENLINLSFFEQGQRHKIVDLMGQMKSQETL